MHVIDGLGVGGTETILYELVSGLVSSGFEVTVCYFNPGPLVEKYSKLDITLIHIPYTTRVDPILFFRLLKVIRSCKPQIVHTHLFKSDIHGLLASRLCGVPVSLTTLHSMNDWAKSSFLGFVYGLVLRLADKVVVLSDEIAEYFIRQSNVPTDRFVTIHNAIPIEKFTQQEGKGRETVREEFGIPEGSPLFGFIARLAPPKDHEVFLYAAVKILLGRPDARFLIVGEGELKTSLIKKSMELGLEKSVIFTGFRKDIPEIFSALDVVVLASRFEGLPVVLMEAMASSRPIVATMARGIISVVTNEVNGLLVQQDDPEALAQACMRLLNDSDLRHKLVEAGLLRAKTTYSIRVKVNKTADLYNSLLEQKHFAL